MASLLRQIVAGPRARHPEADLDLCYVTDHIIATSGPSQTYPQRAYRNPLDRLVGFLDERHGDDWAIWEFRAEGTGYPDEAVHGRVRHYPWPDHHPPPFRLLPMILANMGNWMRGGDLNGASEASGTADGGKDTNEHDKEKARRAETSRRRVVVVHCKAGKGRSGTVSSSYLVAEEGWRPEAALARFTQRRMRPRFGAGVSIPSQLRWVGYVDRWARGGKRYIDRPVEVLEVHFWGLRDGVRVDIAAFADEGKRIEVQHTFAREERVVVEGDAPTGGGLSDMVWEMAGYSMDPRRKAPEAAELADGANDDGKGSADPDNGGSMRTAAEGVLTRRQTELVYGPSTSAPSLHRIDELKNKPADGSSASSTKSSTSQRSEQAEPGGRAVIFRPAQPIRVPNSDVNISVERRNKTNKSMGFTMVTAVAHAWFNVFFEGDGPERGDSGPRDSGVFAVDWDAMDGIKGSSRKGSRAFDRVAVVWRAVGGGEVDEPTEGQPVPQLQAADWAAGTKSQEKDLGLRVMSPVSADVSRASSIRSGEDRGREEEDNDGASLEGVRTSGPTGEELLNNDGGHAAKETAGGTLRDGPRDVLDNPDTASGTTKSGSTDVV